MMNIPETHKILIVDDDPQIHKLLGKMLPQPRFQLLSAFSAEEAYSKLESNQPDMMILDLMMPKVSGIEVCNYVKSTPKHQGVQVLILSAKDAQSDRLDGLQRGADEYIAKPFHMRHLIRKIEYMLANRPAISQ